MGFAIHDQTAIYLEQQDIKMILQNSFAFIIIYKQMGNNQDKENAEFGKNFNFAQHNRKMGQISQNYSNHGFSFQKSGSRAPSRPKQQSFEQMQRKNAFYKPSIDIHMNNQQVKISFQYNSIEGCDLFIYIGVNNINQDPTKKHTTEIQADCSYKQHLAPGTKVQFSKTYPNPPNQTAQKQIILRLQQSPQATQISLRRILKQQQWKIILQKLQIGDKSYELQNIYGGGDNGQECIVCMCEKSDTIVKPCNHLCLCKSCAGIMGANTNKCPICRVAIQGLTTVKTTEQQNGQ